MKALLQVYIDITCFLPLMRVLGQVLLYIYINYTHSLPLIKTLSVTIDKVKNTMDKSYEADIDYRAFPSSEYA